jgi:hypothetical protein
MRPYPRRELDFAKRVFNYRSRAGRPEECAFGILERKFGTFGKAIETAVDLVEASIKSASVLHNFISKEQT